LRTKLQSVRSRWGGSGGHRVHRARVRGCTRALRASRAKNVPGMTCANGALP
jgi:hypothetical protein